MQQSQQVQQDLAAALPNLPQAVAGIPQAVQTAIAAMPVGGGSRRSMIDIQGLDKPSPLQNPEADFVTWTRRIENVIASVFPGAYSRAGERVGRATLHGSLEPLRQGELRLIGAGQLLGLHRACASRCCTGRGH